MAECVKIPYPNNTIAEHALRAISRKKSVQGKRGPTGAYLCADCRRWHLTSKSKSQVPPWSKKRRRPSDRADAA